MPLSIPVEELAENLKLSERRIVIDVRKEPAFAASGRIIAGAVRRLPQEVADWSGAFAGQQVAVYCVHGHEVSQGVAAALEKHGVDAVYLEGGFEAWCSAGGATDAAGSVQ